jgi:hypothetical protein
LRQNELRDQLLPTLNGGHAGWNDDEPAVVEAAAISMLRPFFGTAYDVRSVTDFAAKLHQATAGDKAISQLKAEAVIRLALGESDVSTADISRSEKFRIHMAAMVLATVKTRPGAAALNPVILEAERTAFEQGWNPPLADG